MSARETVTREIERLRAIEAAVREYVQADQRLHKAGGREFDRAYRERTRAYTKMAELVEATCK